MDISQKNYGGVIFSLSYTELIYLLLIVEKKFFCFGFQTAQTSVNMFIKGGKGFCHRSGVNAFYPTFFSKCSTEVNFSPKDMIRTEEFFSISKLLHQKHCETKKKTEVHVAQSYHYIITFASVFTVDANENKNNKTCFSTIKSK